MAKPRIVLAGGTGDLGFRIARELRRLRTPVRAIVRKSSDPKRLRELERLGVMLCPVDFTRPEELRTVCAGATCVVSALSGLHEVIVEGQTRLLEAAVDEGVPRFIPSDFALDFTKLPAGSNRNFDLRREFARKLERSPIQATSILNGAFADMLNGKMPLVLFPLRRVLYWGNADQRIDFTTMDNVASFTALAARDDSTPRKLFIAGDQISARELVMAAGEATGEEFQLLRGGSLFTLEGLIRVARFLSRDKTAVFPAWQGMQYTRDMFSGLGKFKRVDNRRYPGIRWESAVDVIKNGALRPRSS